MPKETFFKLPEEKRTLISNVAIDEFAQHSYERASVNRIVANSGIAKGSFYQYFEGKKDLFLYLVQLAMEEKVRFYSPLMIDSDQSDIFALLKESYILGIQFAAENPELEKISRKISANKDAAVYGEALAAISPSTNELFETLLTNAAAKGEIRANIDIKLLARMITSMNSLVIEYYSERIAQDHHERAIEIVDEFLDFVKNGIGEKCPVSPE